MPNVFTDPQIQAIKNYLGYGNVTASARPFYDVARGFEDILQQYVDPVGVALIVNTILPNLDAIEVDVQGTIPRLRADKVGSIVLNRQEMKQLLEVREFWICRLESTLATKRRAALTNVSVSEVF